MNILKKDQYNNFTHGDVVGFTQNGGRLYMCTRLGHVFYAQTYESYSGQPIEWRLVSMPEQQM